MRSVELGKVGKKIRQIRKSRGMNLQEVANRSDITAGLLSRIENFRTLPSLPVLHKISIALEVPMAELVETVGSPADARYLLLRAGEGEKEEREDSKGLVYENLLSQSINSSNLQVSLITVPPNTYRPPVANDHMELIHVLQGTLSYGLENEKILIRKGDTLYFDGSIPHSLDNQSDTDVVLFKIYLLKLK